MLNRLIKITLGVLTLGVTMVIEGLLFAYLPPVWALLISIYVICFSAAALVGVAYTSPQNRSEQELSAEGDC